MKTFLIAYRVQNDPESAERDLSALYVSIQSLGVFARPMESVWIVSTRFSAFQLHQRLASLFEGEDRLLIVECGGVAEWQGIPLDTSVWMEREFAPARLPYPDYIRPVPTTRTGRSPA